jgi:site-specific recombinase XerD
VTHLRKLMLEELQRRNYSDEIMRSYIYTVEGFARRFNCPPDRLGSRHIREYQAELFQKRKLSSGTVVIRLAALRFFYTETLRRAWNVADTPYPKRAHRLPVILSQEEVAQLIDATCPPFHRTILMTLYATGARCAELTHLKLSDVDNKRMVIHIQDGKECKEATSRTPHFALRLWMRYACQSSPGLPLSTNSIGILSRPINQAMRLPPNATADTGAVKIIMPLSNRRFVVNSMSFTE